jgi:hypothetical protein
MSDKSDITKNEVIVQYIMQENVACGCDHLVLQGILLSHEKTECKHNSLGRVQTVCPTSMEYIQLPKRKRTNSQEMLFQNVVGVDNLQTLFVFVAAITIILKTEVASESTKIPKVLTNPWCCSSIFSLHSTVDHSHTFPKNNLQ